MIFFSTITDCWLGLCRKAPEIHTVSSARIPGTTGNNNSPQPDAGGNTGRPGSIRHGTSIAKESIRALFREKTLLGFSLLSGLVMLFMIVAERWNLMHMGTSYAASSLISIFYGSTHLIVFDLRIFLIEAVCFSGFTLILAALTQYRSARNYATPATFRNAISVPGRHPGALVAFSISLAFAATILWEIAAQNQITGTIQSALTHAMFWLPYAYYFAPNGIFTTLFLSFRMMVVNMVLFLIALYVVPVIILENKTLFPALAKSFRLILKTRRELLGCTIVFGTIILAVSLIGLMIGQSPALINYDYDFFLQVSRGQVMMMADCYGFLLTCGVLMALGSTVLGIAVQDLYTSTRGGEVR